MQTVPLSLNPNENFNITLYLNGINMTFNLFFSWNEASQYWTMDIRDRYKTSIICGIPLISDRDLLAQFEYLNIGHAYFVRKTETAPASSNIDNLNTDYYLLWGDNVR